MVITVETGARQPCLLTTRLKLRRWVNSDREPFAALNADPEVMRYFRGPLDGAASDALMDRIESSFDELGYGLWAVAVRSTGEFIGFTGLARQTFQAHFTPAVEVGWRLSAAAWGHGYATEAARAALDFAFGVVNVDEVVSITTRTNERSQAVMRRIGMTYDPKDDFAYPLLPEGHPLRPHVLHRISRLRLLRPAARIAECEKDVVNGRNHPVPASDDVSHDPRPPGLVGGAQAGRVIAVEVLMEHQVVLPVRVVLQAVDPAEAGSPAVRTDEEDRHEP